MAAYGSGYYGGGNYSYGVSLGEVAVSAASSFSVDGYRFAFADVSVSSVSSVSIDAQRTAFISFEGLDASAVVVGTNVITSTDVLFNAYSSASGSASRYAVGAFFVNPQSSASTTARLKWENYADTAEVWTQLADTSETWTTI